MKRLGYLVPEFPGQTHIFFWRELQSLAKMGIEPDLISTRKPSRALISHAWSEEAMARTTYLSPPAVSALLAGIWEMFRSGPLGWGRVIGGILKSQVNSAKKKLRLIPLAIAGAELAAIARRKKWGHLHVHSCADSANVAMFAHLISGLPYSLTLHGALGDYGPNQAMKWGHAAFGIVITQRLLNEMRQMLGSTPLKIDVAPMGVDVETFQRRSQYQAWDGTGTFRIFSCSRLNPGKGHDDLIRAVGLLNKQGIDAKLQIGGGDDSGGAYESKLKALIAELSLGDRVQLLGAVNEQAVVAGLESAHAFALATLHEALGVAIMEAMAMQLPVVATRVGGVPELVADETDGLLAEAHNPEALAGALVRIAKDPELARRLGTAAQAKVRASFRSDQSARVLADHLQSLLETA